MAEEREGRGGARRGLRHPLGPIRLLCVLFWAMGCGGDPPGEEALQRRGRFGVFRDLVLFDRPETRGGAFFMDRFETTWGDWSDYLVDTAQAAEPRWVDLWGGAEPGPGHRSLPMARVSLGDARDFARWRFCRLPRLEEWIHAATNGGRYAYPWGTQARATWANTADLGLNEPIAVGTFESGRRGAGPYDLVGNVSEWTETPTPRWFLAEQDELGERRPFPAFDFRSGVRRLDRTYGLASLRLWPTPYPAFWIIAAQSSRVPRVVAGWSATQSTRGDSAPPQEPGQAREWGLLPEWQRSPDEWGDDLGLRLVVDPDSLVQSLLRFQGTVGGVAQQLLRRFLDQPGHRRVLGAAWSRHRDFGPGGSLAGFLAAELGR